MSRSGASNPVVESRPTPGPGAVRDSSGRERSLFSDRDLEFHRRVFPAIGEAPVSLTRSHAADPGRPVEMGRSEAGAGSVPDAPAGPVEAVGEETRRAMHSDELERSQRALHLAQDRIAKLTKAQLALSGAVGRLAEEASTDPLSGLSNRRRFQDALKAGLQEASDRDLPLSVVLIDIDSFKSFNDSFGHAAGDQVIWVVAKLLLRNSGGGHVARFGGEEFAVLLPETDEAEAIEVAERQRAAIAAYPWPQRPVTASFGVSTWDRSAGDAVAMLEAADRSLYHSKSRGRDRVTHHRSLEAGPSEGATPATTEGPPDGDPGSSATIFAPPRPIPRTNAQRPQPSGESAWVALERFVQTSRGGVSAQQLHRDVLGAIREGSEAEIVFLCNDQTGEVPGAVGDHVPSHDWYHRLTRRLADELPSGGIWKPSEGLRGDDPLGGPEPSAAIILPVKSPRSCWIVAARFRDGYAFSPADLRASRVIWQLHVDHLRQDRVHDKLKETLFGIVRCLSTAIDAKDPYTCGHSERVARIAVRLGEEMGLGRGETSDLYLAGLLHDLGKIGIRDAVLCKEGPLTPDETIHIREHPVTGERIINNVTRLAYLCPAIRGHHERFDGGGYPDGLAGESIPLMARVLAVADSCDAMMSARRYRGALSEAKIEEIFRQGAGTQWDPRIVRHFLECRHELFAVIQRGLGQSVYYAVERAVGGAETMHPGGMSLSRKGAKSLLGR